MIIRRTKELRILRGKNSQFIREYPISFYVINCRIINIRFGIPTFFRF